MTETELDNIQQLRGYIVGVRTCAQVILQEMMTLRGPEPADLIFQRIVNRLNHMAENADTAVLIALDLGDGPGN